MKRLSHDQDADDESRQSNKMPGGSILVWCLKSSLNNPTSLRSRHKHTVFHPRRDGRLGVLDFKLSPASQVAALSANFRTR
jgi:hypothetical protein